MKKKSQIYFYRGCLFLTWLMIGIVISISIALSFSEAYTNRAYWVDLAGVQITSIQVRKGDTLQLILKAEVPSGKTLYAYNMEALFNPNLVTLIDARSPSGSAFPPMNINKDMPGKVIINAFSVTGVTGPATISFLALTLNVAAEGSFILGIKVNTYGSSPDDQFCPAPQNAVIEIGCDCYYLKISAISQDIGSITINPEKTCNEAHFYTPNTPVTLTANVENPCNRFAYWQGGATGSNNPIEIMMDTNKTVIAVFESQRYSLNTHISPEGSGIVTIDPSKAFYNCGEVITLTAQPFSGYRFEHWEWNDGANHVSGGNPLSITMDGERFITAVFIRDDGAPFAFTPTNTYVFLWGYASINGKPAETGDWIGIFAPGVETNGGCIGAIEIKDPNGLYGVVAAYGDDTLTIEKEGALNGDGLSFKAWDKNTGKILNLNPIGPDRPIWNNLNELLHIDLISESQQHIQLCKGWNLISFQITTCIYDQCFYKEAVPELKRIDTNQIEFEGKSCLIDWLCDDTNSPIRDQYDPNKAGDWKRITSFDESGAHLMDRNLPSFINTLHYLSTGYGYWIKMNKPGIFIIKGQMPDSSMSLDLLKGWNLIGPVQPDICYASDKIPKEEICPYKTGVYPPEENILYCPINPFPDLALASILGKYRRITSFDSCNGAMLYDTQIPPQINTLHYIGPKYGYWIKMLEDTKLTFPDGSVCNDDSNSIPHDDLLFNFTHVPEWGVSDEYLKGIVHTVSPDTYRIVVYIKVENVWWIKPYEKSPYTSIKEDLTWECAIVTGGIDENATEIIAFLIPNTYNVPLLLGASSLPQELFDNALAYASTTREPRFRKIDFSGYSWVVKSGKLPMGPGDNYFTDSNQNVWVDNNGYLHLKITHNNENDRWECAEVIGEKSLGYGKYSFYLGSRVDQINENAVLGLFTWDNLSDENHREIDIEFSRWGDSYNLNSQYVVQPYYVSGNMYRFTMNLENTIDSIHSFTWKSNSIYFDSLSGANPGDYQTSLINSFYYTGSFIPTEGNENPRINLWLMSGKPPTDLQGIEVIIKRFEFTPIAQLSY